MQNEVTLVKQYTSHVLVIYYRTNFWFLSLFTELISYNTVFPSLASVMVVDRSDRQQGPCGDTILLFLKNSIYKDTEILEVKKVSETILNVALFVTSSLLVKKITPKSHFLYLRFNTSFSQHMLQSIRYIYYTSPFWIKKNCDRPLLPISLYV